MPWSKENTYNLSFNSNGHSFDPNQIFVRLKCITKLVWHPCISNTLIDWQALWQHQFQNENCGYGVQYCNVFSLVLSFNSPEAMMCILHPFYMVNWSNKTIYIKILSKIHENENCCKNSYNNHQNFRKTKRKYLNIFQNVFKQWHSIIWENCTRINRKG